MIEAMKKKNSNNFKKAISWLVKYNEANDLRTIAEDNDESATELNKHNRKCENTFDKYLQFCEELPKYEVKRIENSNLY